MYHLKKNQEINSPSLGKYQSRHKKKSADRHQHRQQERAKEQGQISKRDDIDATNFQAIINFKEWRRFTLCVLLYSAAGRRGYPMPDNLTLVSGQ